MPRGLKIELAAPWLSLNEWLGMNRFIAAECKQRIGLEIRAKVAAAGVVSLTPPRFRVAATFTRYSPGELDFDNLVGGAKALVDQLRYAHLIRDDKATWFAGTYRQEKCRRGEGRSVIELEALGEPECLQCKRNVLDCECRKATRKLEAQRRLRL